MNLARKAREATGLTSSAFAELLGVPRPQVSRWEKTGKWPAVAEALFHLLAASPKHCVRAIRVAKGLEAGFVGDGGPPPTRQRQIDVAAVDEYGFPTATGPSPEPDLGFEPGAFEVPTSPDFEDDSDGDDAELDGPDLPPRPRFDQRDDELVNEDELVGGDTADGLTGRFGLLDDLGDGDDGDGDRETWASGDDEGTDPDEVPSYSPTF